MKIYARTLPAFLILAFCAVGFTFSQKNKPTESPGGNGNAETEREFNHWLTIYNSSLGYNDLSTATTAAFAILALKPEASNWKDSLAFLFFQRGAYDQCVRVGKDVLAATPKDTAILELVAVSEQTLGMLKEALADYENLYALAGDMHHLYEIATIQFQMKRFGECEITINGITNLQGSDKTMVTIISGNNEQQLVPLKAAAINMKGVIALELSKNQEAKILFDQALEIFPEFILAKNNKEHVEKLLK